MYELLLAAGVLLAGDAPGIMNVCFDKELTIVGEPRRMADFYLVDVRGRSGAEVVSIYIGAHPDIGK